MTINIFLSFLMKYVTTKYMFHIIMMPGTWLKWSSAPPKRAINMRRVNLSPTPFTVA